MAVKSADQITVYDVTDAYSVNLTVDSFTLAGTTAGAAATAATLESTVQVYKGDIALTASDVSIGSITGITGATATANGLKVTISVTTACTGGSLSIPITVEGEVQFTKTISIAIAKTGGTGAGAYHYSINASSNAVVKAESGTLTPSSITFSATRAQGTGNPASYSGRFKIEYSTDGSTWTAGYTSSANEASKAYTIPAAAVLVRCSLYLAGGTTTLLAIQTVPVIAEGNTGAAGKGVSSITGHYLATSAASGVTTSTSGWSTSIQTVTATNKYLWYYETISYINPNSSANTTPVISGVYGDKGQKGDQGDQGDQGDPGADAILISITASAGTIFKNTTGSTTLTANVFVGGVAATVASNGTVTFNGSTIGTIKWYKGTAVTGTAGNSISVSASEVSGTMAIKAQLET